ncbi:Predicted flavoprotein CzcO associated with the cation diffusion facilitator CzcD [Amycolatopsis arida]|uniref:Predicted flavoprotein CzcO associated with the cation diffusion facilitator CzcD n=1 Tax=Amycolatopsis arida TaxID=587909 RepID=A0A1I5P064_9PSEU|nr:NAD(P)/FAD-dependent oxidoreductase [Amycolatopsis arida]TDX98289.1 cation diffusion facilitator CzcD-associated flavoprotein CzcO [Amycolatopsis arida]SFP26906.1 Predicted flavoprotein CzcO associated with the cation diffusion facilitator CzcD [Amycolatopsis arida]
MGKRTEVGVVIVGTGFSGLGMAIKLRKEGRDDFVILEKAHDVGGTWRDNTYPGCACDIQSHMYSFSFEQNPDWTRSFSPQREIWDYLRRVAEKYDLYRFVRFGQEMTGARWDADEGRWHVSTRSGDEFVGQFLVSGVGALHVPQTPRLPGIERFQGRAFHSAEWDHDFDLRGKRVAVIGTGASAIQFVPQIAKDVDRLTVFQRTPPWIMPKPDHAMPGWARTLFHRVPGVQRLYRHLLYWLLEVRAIGFNGHPGMMKLAQLVAKRHIAKQVRDPEVRRKITPDYTMGCKRVLISNDYYPALNRDNVELVTDGVAEVREHAVVDAAGVEHEVDAIIFGTGFHVTDAFDGLDILGQDGRDLSKEWATHGMRTHLGITVSGYPNLFFLLGPNTGLGHNSVVFMIESQVRYVAEAIRYVEDNDAAAIDVRADTQAQFNADIQRKLEKGIWTQGGCKSWYLDAMGVNRTIWPGFTWRYWQRTRRLEPADFELIGRAPARSRRSEPTLAKLSA